MPRKSAEDRAAAAWRARGEPPPPPKHLGRKARAVWREIVKSRPPDFFPTGVLPLLEGFCVASVATRDLAAAVEAAPSDKAAADAWISFAKVQVSLATKLRLVNTASRASGVHDEKGAHDPLIGGQS